MLDIFLNLLESSMYAMFLKSFSDSDDRRTWICTAVYFLCAFASVTAFNLMPLNESFIFIADILLAYLYLRTTVDVDVLSMLLSIVQVVIIPIGLGLLINKFFGKYTQKITGLLPAVSVTAICLIVAAVVSHNSGKILSTGPVIFAVVILHNLLGYLCGFLTAVLFKMDLPRKKAVAIEIGMQNSGLAASLAGSAFPNLAMATVPGAIFSVWHNISGAILAGILKTL